MKWYRIYLAVLTLTVCFAFIAECIDRTEIEDTAKIQRLMDSKRRVDHIHPFLENTYPVAVVRNDSFYVYDAAGRDQRYRFILSAPSPLPVRGSIRASFPLDFYDRKAACIFTPDVFDGDDSVITLCHEFVHCGQWHNGEQKIRRALVFAGNTAQSDDPMWEINYPFPYKDKTFVTLYSRFFDALKRRDQAGITECRTSLKEHLDPADYAYMVFQEWKEGLARYVENRVSRQLGKKEYTYGNKQPFGRISFYAGGAAYIEYLERRRPGIADTIVRLVNVMNDSP